MKLEGLHSSDVDGRKRISATIKWEDNDREAQEIFFETDEEFGPDLACNPHIFLVSSLIPAMRAGEKRIQLAQNICPELRVGLETAMKWTRQWHYDPERPLVRIETKAKKAAICDKRRPRTAFFFSGGVDSLATLRANHLNIPTGHPGFIQDGILIYGLEVSELDPFSHVRHSLAEIAADTGITLIPIYTNVRSLDEDWHFWEQQWEGAVFAAIAHGLVNRIGTASIASTYDIANMMPLGSHPLIDPLYSSCNLRILHDGITRSRYDRTNLIAKWDVGRNNLRVCNQSEFYTADTLNCGKCEKCIRTMLAFLAIGVLDKMTAFPVREISPETVAEIRWISANARPFYREMIQPLYACGRGDLAAAIEKKLHQYDPPEPKKKTDLVVDVIRRADGKYFSGRLGQLKRMLSG